MKTPATITALFLLSIPLFAQSPSGNPTDFLSAIATAIQHKGGECPGLYQYTHGNALPQGWLEQTPNIWGKKPADLVPWAHSKQMGTDIGDMIAKAEKVVDITTLAPAPDGWWAGEIVRGLRTVAQSGRPVTVRILVGIWPTGPGFDAQAYLKTLGKQLEGIPGNKLIIYAAGQRSEVHSWNHSKIVQVDGRYAMTGGHNLWPHDYLGPYPAHDVSMRVEGPAAFAAFNFANVLWDYVRWCNGKGPCAYQPQSYRWTVGHIIKEAPPGIDLSAPAAVGNVPIIAVGRAGRSLISCSKDANPSDTAMIALFDHAQESIRLSQQDLELSKCGHDWRKVWADGMNALGRAIARGVDLQIVMSNYKAQAGEGETYSTCVGADEVWHDLAYQVAMASGYRGPQLHKRMREKVHIATLHFGPGTTWSNGWPFANHAKMIIVDDSAFYIGSTNFYSTDLQEFGYVVQNPAAMATLLSEYWEPMWKYSAPYEYVPKESAVMEPGGHSRIGR